MYLIYSYQVNCKCGFKITSLELCETRRVQKKNHLLWLEDRRCDKWQMLPCNLFIKWKIQPKLQNWFVYLIFLYLLFFNIFTVFSTLLFFLNVQSFWQRQQVSVFGFVALALHVWLHLKYGLSLKIYCKLDWCLVLVNYADMVNYVKWVSCIPWYHRCNLGLE